MPARKSRLGYDLDIVGDSAIATAPTPRAVDTEPEIKRALVAVNIRLDRGIVDTAKRVARLSGDSLSDLVREALSREVRRREKQLVTRLREEASKLEELHAG
jgi:hypothetical protein